MSIKNSKKQKRGKRRRNGKCTNKILQVEKNISMFHLAQIYTDVDTDVYIDIYT